MHSNAIFIIFCILFSILVIWVRLSDRRTHQKRLEIIREKIAQREQELADTETSPED